MKRLCLLLLLFTPAAAYAQHSMPPGMSHEEHLKQMKKDEELKTRGHAAMGFNQDSSTHHFLLQKHGGAIVVTSTGEVDAVRSHLRDIAAAFGRGEFDKPFATHAEVPPGVPVMIERRARITYRYEDRANGGAVVLTTTDRTALDAIHDFLRYQIVEHKTGDPLTVSQ